MKFHEKLRALRPSDVSQEERAQQLGLSRSSYSLYEIGKREPDLATLQRICNFYNITADYFIEDDCNLPVSPPRLTLEEIELINNYREKKEPWADNLPAMVLDDNEVTVIELYRLLTPEQKGEIRGMMKGFSSSSSHTPSTKVYRAANSTDGETPRIIDMDDERLKSLVDAPDADLDI